MNKNKCYVIPTESFCNAKCFFCISKSTKRIKREYMIIDNMFYSTLNQLLSIGVNCFEFTGGGEPLFNENLQQIINEIRSAAPHAYIKLYTNGSIHKEINGIDELIISTVHWNDQLINDIYKTNPERHLLSDLLFFHNPMKYKLRLSVPIFRGGIDNPIKAIQLIKSTNKYVDSYVFRPLLEKTTDRDSFYVDFDLEMENVEIDRDCSCFSDIKLWWSDNEVYKNWFLTERL